MKLLWSSCAAVLLIGSASAQNAHPPALGKEILNRIANRNLAMTQRPADKPASGTGSIVLKHPQAPIKLGWHSMDALDCGWWNDGQGNDYFYTQDGKTIIYNWNSPLVTYGMMSPCVHGYKIAFHVVDTTTGRFDQTYSYTYP